MKGKKMSIWSSNKLLSEWMEDNWKNILETELDYFTPEPRTDPLVQALSDSLGIDKSNIFVAAGTNQLIHSIFNYNKWDEIFVMNPDYGLYESILKNCSSNQQYNIINEKNICEFFIKLRKLNSSENDLLCISSPRWFDGIQIDVSEIMKLLENFNGTILIDEAYIDYSSKSVDTMTLANTNSRIILTRSFSKGYFLPGLRVAYAISTGFNEKFRLGGIVPHSIATPSSKFVVKLLEQKNILNAFTKMQNKIRSIRTDLINSLSTLEDVWVSNSEANFITFKLENRGDDFISKNVVPIHKVGEGYYKYWITNDRESQMFLNNVIEHCKEYE
ncbi:MAG: aminotransferase class I/II-fold pyridoxal phosphate-dependent enzyme [Clostridiales bacterium]|nr:aminotransferase class I/II-fold pyridoxal phosphate-dependent enzyme [Clostridiales bacterium]